MNTQESPLQVKIGFKKLIAQYEQQQHAQNTLVAQRAKAVLAALKPHKILVSGIDDFSTLEKYRPVINVLLEDLFAEVLTTNEIKLATIPFQTILLKASARYNTIREQAGEDFTMELMDFSPDEQYIMGCSVVLNLYYGYSIDFRRPFYYKIPDKNGILRAYRVLYNGDFATVEKGPNAREITPEDVAELLDNFDNIAMWKDKFPPHSWIFNGFVIANMYDATIDVSLANFKEYLLDIDTHKPHFIARFQEIIQSVFGQSTLQIGFAIYEDEAHTLCRPLKLSGATSFLILDAESEKCEHILCENSYQHILKEREVLALSDIKKYHKAHPKNALYRTLHKQNLGSAIIAPLVHENEILGLFEIVSPQIHALNSINANKLKDILPYLVEAVKRAKQQKENQMDLLIQQECTSIHPSVYWRFKEEAKRVLEQTTEAATPQFGEIVFNEVYPLFGQLDIKGSSEARNRATKLDLQAQLQEVNTVLVKANAIANLPIYEQYVFRIQSFLKTLSTRFEVNTEQQINAFLLKEINPLFAHLEVQNKAYKLPIQAYKKQLDTTKGTIYRYRKAYDDAVMQVNRTLAMQLDDKQAQAQSMYPHYYERFKTDGVEFNLYIGESITKTNSFHKVYLYNLRLWQLQVMCELENEFFRMQQQLPVPLEVASLILAFNAPLALRFRMDEKRFDVDGTYNARYEVVKKRVDKATVKGKKERITQPGKIVIVYSQHEDELEYLQYIAFLQNKRILNTKVEMLEVQDLQGVTGLKAIRVGVVLNKEAKPPKTSFTYNDLLETLAD